MGAVLIQHPDHTAQIIEQIKISQVNINVGKTKLQKQNNIQH